MRRSHNFERIVEKNVSRSERAFCQREICTYCARIFPDSSPKKKGSDTSKHNIQHFILSHAIVYCGDTETLLGCGWGNCVFTFLPCVNEYFSKNKCYHLECSAGIKLKNLLLESYWPLLILVISAGKSIFCAKIYEFNFRNFWYIQTKGSLACFR